MTNDDRQKLEALIASEAQARYAASLERERSKQQHQQHVQQILDPIRARLPSFRETVAEKVDGIEILNAPDGIVISLQSKRFRFSDCTIDLRPTFKGQGIQVFCETDKLQGITAGRFEFETADEVLEFLFRVAAQYIYLRPKK